MAFYTSSIRSGEISIVDCRLEAMGTCGGEVAPPATFRCSIHLQPPTALAHNAHNASMETSKRLHRSREILRIFHGEKLNLGVYFWAADRRSAVNLAPAIHIDQWWYHSRWVTKMASL